MRAIYLVLISIKMYSSSSSYHTGCYFPKSFSIAREKGCQQAGNLSFSVDDWPALPWRSEAEKKKDIHCLLKLHIISRSNISMISSFDHLLDVLGVTFTRRNKNQISPTWVPLTHLDKTKATDSDSNPFLIRNVLNLIMLITSIFLRTSSRLPTCSNRLN